MKTLLLWDLFYIYPSYGYHSNFKKPLTRYQQQPTHGAYSMRSSSFLPSFIITCFHSLWSPPSTHKNQAQELSSITNQRQWVSSSASINQWEGTQFMCIYWPPSCPYLCCFNNSDIPLTIPGENTYHGLNIPSSIAELQHWLQRGRERA